MNPSTATARIIVDELIAGGITDAVLAPGSRSAPLAFALHAADAAGLLRLHVRIDERGAGFLALGFARATGRPTPVVTTSGTAVANLHPAVLEAHHDGVPLLVLSADRPAHLRGVGANQVIEQLTVFGSGVLRHQHELAIGAGAGYVRGQVCRALAAASGALTGGLAGPAQLNIPFDVPLTPDGSVEIDDGVASRRPWARLDGSPAGAPPIEPPGDRTLIIADLTHPAAAEFAARGHVVLSEAGGAAGPGVLSAGMHLIADRDFVERNPPDRVVILGRPTLYRAVTALLQRPDLTVDVVDHPARFADPGGVVRAVSPQIAAGSAPTESDFVAAWRDADTAACDAVDTLLADTELASSAALARAVAGALPETAALFLGSSQLPRDIGRYASARSRLAVFANRGVAGIDGTISTAIGLALGQPEVPTYALMGDLTFLHDLTALAIGPHEPTPDLTIVVANNDGGGIFATLEQGSPKYAGPFERIFGTPTSAQFAQLCEGFGVPHDLVTTRDELTDALRQPPEGLTVIEVPTSRTDLRDFAAQVAAAVAGAINR